METSLKKLIEFSQDPYSHLASWKAKNNRKIIGLTPMYIPEELIHASAMLPVEMWSSNEAITLGHVHVTPHYCGLTQSIVDDFIKNKLAFLDGVITYETCIQARTLMLIIEKNKALPFLESIFLPNQLANPVTRAYLLETLENFKKRLEEFAGLEITDAALEESISIYNKNRGLLRQLYEMRRNRPGMIKVSEIVPIVHCSMIMPKEDHNRLMEELIPELKERPENREVGIKVILVGSLCTAPSAQVLQIIDDSGITVTDDDLYVGSRYFANDAQLEGNPIEALGDRFLARTPPCPTKVDAEMDWTDYIIDKVKDSGAQGVITLIQKNCPPHMCYSPDVMRRLSKAGIPELVLELEHEATSLEPMKTRLHAFKEIVGGA
jgi:benzoyl-CoA reductase subunit C